MAAYAAVVIGIGAVLVWNNFLPAINDSGNITGSTAGYSMSKSYAGPVFPLTLSKEDNTITAARNIKYDFPLSRNIIVFGKLMLKTLILLTTSSKKKNYRSYLPICRKFRRY